MGIKTEGLKKRRKALGLSLVALADEALVPIDAVVRWETGHMKPEDKFDDLFRICKVLGIKFAEISKRSVA